MVGVNGHDYRLLQSRTDQCFVNLKAVNIIDVTGRSADISRDKKTVEAVQANLEMINRLVDESKQGNLSYE